MNNPNSQNPTAGPAKSDQTQPKGVPPSFDSQKPQDSRDAAPDDIGKKPDAGKSSYLPNSGREDLNPNPPAQAARGDDDLMSKKPGKQG